MKTRHEGMDGTWWHSHTCETMKGAEWEAHGHAVTDVSESSERPGVWWADNGEYATAISFCPFCGVKLADEK